MPIQHSTHAFSRRELTGTIQDYLLPIVRDSGRTHISATPTEMPEHETYLRPGTVIGERHVVEEWLGNHAITQVYRIRHATISTFSYILKTPRSSFADHHEVITQFHTEASALARLRDPLTPQIIDLGTLEDGRPFLCLEIIPGLTLDELTRIYGPQPEPVVWHIGADILSIIAEMHELGMTHGNLQPSSIRLWKDPSSSAIHPRLLDFSTTQTHAPEEMGQFSPTWDTQYRQLFTSKYLAPDCLADRHFPTCDVYSLGLVLAELLDGAPVFANDQRSMRSSADARIHSPHVILGPHAQKSAMSRLLMRALHPNPNHRYPNAAAMLHDLLEIAEEREPGIVSELSENVSDRFYGTQNTLAQPNPASPRIQHKRPQQISETSQLPPAQSTNLGTARMYKVPTGGHQFPEKNTVVRTENDSTPTLWPGLSLAARIVLILAFMTAALSILFLGLPI